MGPAAAAVSTEIMRRNSGSEFDFFRPPRRDWRDWFIMATVTGGVSYGLYTVAKVTAPSIFTALFDTDMSVAICHASHLSAHPTPIGARQSFY